MTDPIPNYELPEPPEYDQALLLAEDGMSKPTGAAVMITDTDDQSGEDNRAHEVNAAYGVKPFFWKEQELFPFAVDREGDWMLHRELLGTPDLREIIGLYKALVPDALRVLWFCSVDPSEWVAIPTMYLDGDLNWKRRTGSEKALIVEAKIREWARLNVSRSEAPLAVDTFYEIFQSAQSTRAVAKPSDLQKEDKAKN